MGLLEFCAPGEHQNAVGELGHLGHIAHGCFAHIHASLSLYKITFKDKIIKSFKTVTQNINSSAGSFGMGVCV